MKDRGIMEALNTQMSSLGLSVKPIAHVEHEPATTPAAWRENLSKQPIDAPANFELLKTLVFKFKAGAGAKLPTPPPVALVLVARESTDTSTASTVLAKKLGLKDMRPAGADLLQDIFALDKDSSESSSFQAAAFFSND